MPSLSKFDGTGNPNIHAIQYATAMAASGAGRTELVKLFALSLEGAAAVWYHTLKDRLTLGWEELVEKFVAHYHYNTSLDVNVYELETLKQKHNESFAEFMCRWSEKASKMTERPPEREQVKMIIRNLRPELMTKMLMSPITTFAQLREMGYQIQDAYDRGLFRDEHKMSYQSKRLTGFGAGPNSKPEAELNEIGKPERRFSELGKSMSKIFDILKEKGFLASLNATPKNPHKLKKEYFCAYHGHHGHETDKCVNLRHAIQDLIDDGKIPDPEKRAPKAW